MKAYLYTLSVMVLGYVLASCGGQPGSGSNAAIQRAIEEHVASRPGLASDQLVMEVLEIQISGDTAEAEVMFRSQADRAAMMAFHYQLRSEGNHWKVESGWPSQSGSAHPSPGLSPETDDLLPEGHPPIEQIPSQPQQ